MPNLNEGTLRPPNPGAPIDPATFQQQMLAMTPWFQLEPDDNRRLFEDIPA
jgi:hypothetical protein